MHYVSTYTHISLDSLDTRTHSLHTHTPRYLHTHMHCLYTHAYTHFLHTHSSWKHPSSVCGCKCVAVCCSVLQCVAVCCSVLQCVAVCCSVLQCVAVCCSVLQCVTVCCSVLQCVAVCCCVLLCVAVCCSVGQEYVRWKSTNQSACVNTHSICMHATNVYIASWW